MTTGSYLELRETHSAGLLLVGDTALKFKKPVDLGFLDFTSRRTRVAVCEAEVALKVVRQFVAAVREKAEAAGGSLVVISRPGLGTVVTGVLPLRQN
jgi:aminoglycoside phosphotransferase family enzyme